MSELPNINNHRAEAESKFSAFGGYPRITRESIDKVVQTIDKAAVRELAIASILPLHIKRELSNEDIQTWVTQGFVEIKFKPIHEIRMKAFEQKANEGDKMAILVVSMFEEGSALSQYGIVDKWNHIEELAKKNLGVWKCNIRGTYGAVTPDDWNGNMQRELSKLVGEVQQEIQSIREQLTRDSAGSSLKQEFEAYVQSLRERKQKESERYLDSHKLDTSFNSKLKEVENRIIYDIGRLAKWQMAISKCHSTKEGRFGPEAITIPNESQMGSLGIDRGFSGQVNVDQKTGDLTLDLGNTGNVFASPPEFIGLKLDGFRVRMEFRVKELHSDSHQEEYNISLGFGGEYGSTPFLQFVCTETGQMSDKIYFGSDSRLDMTMVVRKPVIYLYSDENIIAKVEVVYSGKFTTVYPNFTGGNEWIVKTLENGLVECQDRTYPYLFWEGIPNVAFDTNFEEGFCVKRDDLREFLEDKLAALGLNSKEQTDFITYWLPVLDKNEFNLIQFCIEEYEDKAKLKVEPKPDQLIRVFMKFKVTASYTEIGVQELTKIERRQYGFVVVEWGGVDVGCVK